MVPLVPEHGLQACELQKLRHVGSVVAVSGLRGLGSVLVGQGLSCSVARGIFLDQGSDLSSALAGRIFATEPLGKP